MSPEAPGEAYSAPPVCIQEMQEIIAGGLIELFVSLVPITLIRFVGFPPHTMVAKALGEKKVQ